MTDDMTDDQSGENFLRRWSRRKIEEDARVGDVPETISPDDVAPVEPAAEDGADDVVADLPDIETLDKDSDYTVFLRDGVPEELKRLALRKLWLSDPVLANLDGLNDYDDDFATILKTGADYMQRLAKAGEKLTRPGAEEEEEDGTEDVEEIADAEGPATDLLDRDENPVDSDAVALDEAGEPPDAVEAKRPGSGTDESA